MQCREWRTTTNSFLCKAVPTSTCLCFSHDSILTSHPSFDDPDFDRAGTTFNIDDWITHTPKAILAKNFGVDAAIFDSTPSPNPFIVNATAADPTVTGGMQLTDGTPASWVYRTLQKPSETVAGGGGVLFKIDSTNFPVSKTIAATFVRLRPGALRELHWHPNVSGSRRERARTVPGMDNATGCFEAYFLDSG